ncbi:HNH endonuclease [Dyella sp. 20L07]|uniref:HNH endonuclease n=1 Tax=Dyella sp. 20L07 TaxID=3384240 RepID=UPI003D2E2C87
MKSLCSAGERSHLLKLMQLVQAGTLSGTQAWGAFSVPEASKKFMMPNGKTQEISFTRGERKTYEALRESTQIRLFQKYGRSCAYCRRSVGHYGYDWHIEHVLPKSKYPSHTFKLANLTVGCVHCNRWKGVRVDRFVENKVLPIINPVEAGFRYSQHLRYLHLGTEEISLVKYSPCSPQGSETYRLLSLEELERAHAIDSMDGVAAALHERLTLAMSAGSAGPKAEAFVELLAGLRSAIYRRP